MAWRDDLREASFRDVPFRVAEAQVAGGRRGPTHEYPEREEPYAEDQGAKARSFSLDAYVLGPDYMVARDRLLEALRAPGPGTLVHPYLGTQRVVCRDWSLRESTRDGGFAAFRLTFHEAGANRFPGQERDTRARVDAASDGALSAARDLLEDAFEASRPGWLRDDAAELLGSLASELESSVRRLGQVEGDLDTFLRDTVRLSSEAADLVGTPGSLAARVTDLVSDLGSLPASSERAFGAMLRLSGFEDDAEEVPQTTPNRRQARRNRALLGGLVRRAAVAEAARQAARVPLASRDEAVAVRERIAEPLEREILAAADAGEDEARVALELVYAEVVRDLQARGASLARIRHVELAGSLPALVLAHRLYQDAERADEIVARNGVRHPGFVPGGVRLEVLTDG